MKRFLLACVLMFVSPLCAQAQLLVHEGATDVYAYFVAQDSSGEPKANTDPNNYTIRIGRNGALLAAMSSPTLINADPNGQSGLMALLVDEDTSMDPNHDFEQLAFHVANETESVKAFSFDVLLYRPKGTLGETATIAGGNINSDVQALEGADVGSEMENHLWGAVASGSNGAGSMGELLNLADDIENDSSSLIVKLGAPVGADFSVDLQAVKTVVDAILVDTGTSGVVVDPNTDLPVAIDSADAAAIAAKVTASRGDYYPPRSLVWVLSRDATSDIIAKVNGNQVAQTKQPTEVAKRWIDFAALLGKNESVESIDSLSIAGGTFAITANSEDITGNLVSLVITDGASGETGTVTITVTTTEGQVLTTDNCTITVP